MLDVLQKCPSVSLSVCLSVTSGIVSEGTKLVSFMVSSLTENVKTLVFANIRFILKFKGGHLEREMCQMLFVRCILVM